MNIPDLGQQSDDLVNLNRLYEIQFRLNAYVIKNLQALSETPTSITETAMDPNLFKIAVKYYGNSNFWPIIARANLLTDPMPIGTFTLVIPPKPTVDPKGVLNYYNDQPVTGSN